MNERAKEALMNAVVGGNINDVKNAFNEHTLEIDNSYFDYKLLQAAFSHKHDSIIHFLLYDIGCRAGNPINTKAEETPLHYAMKSNNSGFIKQLLSNGALIFVKNENGEIPLLTGFKNKSFDAVRSLLTYSKPQFKCKPKHEDAILYFHIACVRNNISAATYYLKYNVNPNDPLRLDFEKYSGFNPLQYAAEEDYYILFIKLVCHGGDLSIKDALGFTPLHLIYYYSSTEDRAHRIKQIFENGNNTKFINAVDGNGVSHFHLCCMSNDPTFVQVFIDNGANVNSSISSDFMADDSGYTPLHFAVINGCEKTVELLLKNGADYNERCNNIGRTPLHLVNKISGYWKGPIVKMLLDYKASPIIPDNIECTPIHTEFLHSKSENKYVLEMLFSKISGNNNFSNYDGLSLFHIACTMSNTRRIKCFLDSGVEIDSCVCAGMYKGYSALHFAVLHNQLNVVKLLLKHNAQVNIKANKTQVTPLHLACEFNYMKFSGTNSFDTFKNFESFPINLDSKSNRTNQLNIIKLLLSHGADVDARDYQGVTPLLRTCMIDFNYDTLNGFLWSSKSLKGGLIKEISTRTNEIIEMLISCKAKVTACSNKLETILHIISKYKSLKIKEKLIKLIVTEGAKVDAIQNDGFTPVHLAVKATNKSMLQILLKHKANVNIKCRMSKLPLDYLFPEPFYFEEKFSIINKNKEIFCALLENSNDLNIVDKYGRTLLHDALFFEDYFIIKKLLDYGADINVEDPQDNSCLFVFEMKHSGQRNDLFRMEDFVDIFEIVYIHVQKLLALGLYVSEKVQKCCRQLLPKYKAALSYFEGPSINLDNTFKDCIEELEKMKLIKVDNYTSLYSILLKNPHELAMYVKNTSLTRIINDRNVNKKFPFYNYLLKLQFRRGLSRSHYNNLIQSAKASLCNIINVNLPDLCLDLIFKYLSGEDINTLQNVIPSKRILKRKLNNNTSKQIDPLPKLRRRKS